MPIIKRQPLRMEAVILELARAKEVNYPTSDPNQIHAQLRLQDQPEQDVFRAIKLLKQVKLVVKSSRDEPGRYQTSIYRQRVTGGDDVLIKKTSKNRIVTLRLDQDVQIFCDALWSMINARLVLSWYLDRPSTS